jgi:LmbE family N-acetylglucosaminyl deacetylase
VLRLALDAQGADPLVVLALGAHSDDIEIGCGGTILRLVDSFPRLEIVWVVLAAHGDRAEEAKRSAEAFLAGASESRVVVATFRDSFFPYHGAEVKEFVESLKEIEPGLILTHHRADLHQDHRLVSELTWNAFRDHLILEYEVPKYDGDLGRPNLFVHLNEETCRHKIELIMRHFETQRSRHWFTEDLFLSVMRLRGMESNSPTRYAEGFHCSKIAL